MFIVVVVDLLYRAFLN